ncbi:MAG: nitroreductase family protein, partial [Halanaerobium sp.]|nr:nitroreductase family protein [Halanaerobium sp.]
MEFMDVIKKRRSARSFLDKQVPEDILRKILEAGRLAPSGGNAQNTFFGIVRDKERKLALARAAGKQEWIAEAPLIIAYCTYIGFDLAEVEEGSFALAVNLDRFGADLV